MHTASDIGGDLVYGGGWLPALVGGNSELGSCGTDEVYVTMDA